MFDQFKTEKLNDPTENSILESVGGEKYVNRKLEKSFIWACWVKLTIIFVDQEES